MIFETDSIELYYGTTKILNSVYLKAETGKITGLLGRNGSGKSSLFNVIFGHLKSQNSYIRLNDNVYLKPLFSCKRASYLHQKRLIPKGISVKKAFTFYNLDLNIFFNKFSELKINANQKIKTLSGGERRIIEIYLTLMRDVDLVLLDEPFNHLSPIYVEKIEALLAQEKKHKAIIISDHIFRPILRLSDTIYFLDKGNMKEIKTKEDLEKLHYIT